MISTRSKPRKKQKTPIALERLGGKHHEKEVVVLKNLQLHPHMYSASFSFINSILHIKK
jgi:hypothetical protein